MAGHMNLFRLVGDGCHLLSFVVMFWKLFTSKSVAGISLKTQARHHMHPCAALVRASRAVRVTSASLRDERRVAARVDLASSWLTCAHYSASRLTNPSPHPVRDSLRTASCRGTAFSLSLFNFREERRLVPPASPSHVSAWCSPEIDVIVFIFHPISHVGAWCSQEIYVIVFMFRYLDLFWNFLSAYNWIMKCIFIISSLSIVYIMRFGKPHKDSYDQEDDAFPHIYLIVPSALLGLAVNQASRF